jgi:hypothetical protein
MTGFRERGVVCFSAGGLAIGPLEISLGGASEIGSNKPVVRFIEFDDPGTRFVLRCEGDTKDGDEN